VDAAGIPRAVEQFIARHITSVEQLELLLLLRRQPDVSLTPAEASRRLHTSPHSAGTRLAELERSRLVARDGDAYRYGADAETDACVADVERYYSTHRARMIFSRPSDEVLGFADAFRLRRKP
jgi:hypothetical protein